MNLINHVFILVALITSLVVHVHDSSNPFFDRFAEQRITNDIRQKVKLAVTAEYLQRGLPYSLAQIEIDKQTNILLESPEFEQAKHDLAERYRDLYRDPSGADYLRGADPYLFIGEAKNILNYGHTGTAIKDGESWNMLRNPPYGTPSADSLLSHVEAALFRTVNLFIPVSLERIVFHIPLLFALISTLLVFFIVKAVSNSFGGFFAAIIFSLQKEILSVTRMGFTDTNSLNITFTLLIVLLTIHLVKSILQKQSNIKKLSLAAAIVTSTLLFRFNWKGYYYILFIIMLSAAIYIINRMFINRRFRNYRKIIIATTALTTLAVGFLFISSRAFSILLMRLRLQQSISFFPDATNTVGELQRMSLMTMIDSTGKLIFIIGMFSAGYCTYLWLSRLFSKRISFSHVLFSIWYFLLLAATLFARRFLSYFVIVLCILAGMILSQVPKYALKALHSLDVYLTKKATRTIAVLIVLALVSYSAQSNLLDDSAIRSQSMMDDAIYDSAIAVKEAADPGSMLFTWWDYGYLYQYHAGIPVLVDAGLFQTPRVYWFSTALMSSDETFSTNTLQMLACGGNSAFYTLSERMTELDAINMIFQALEQGSHIPDDIHDLMRCDRPKDLIAVSDKMADLSHILYFFSEWDFNVSAQAPEMSRLSSTERWTYLKLNYNISTAGSIYDKYTYMTSGVPNTTKIIRPADDCEYSNRSLICGGVTLIGPDDPYAKVRGVDIPYIVTLGNHSKQSPDFDSDTVLIVHDARKGVETLLVDAEISESLLVKLLYLDGDGLDHFRKLKETDHPHLGRVLVYEIDYAAGRTKQ